MNTPSKKAIATHGSPMTRRWVEQRWLIDNIIRSVGIDWDQPRSISYNAPCGAEANADFAAIRERVKKYADISPAFETAARRREARARAAEDAQECVTARQNYFIAAVQYAAAQWPHDENSDKNVSLNQRKRECYSNYAKYAERKVEAAWIPFQGRALPGWFHLPPDYKGGRIPAVVSIPGMDGFKEASVAMYGDRWLSRNPMMVDFPEPDGPTRAVTVPGSDRKEIPCRTGLSFSYSKKTFSNSTAPRILPISRVRSGSSSSGFSLSTSLVRSRPATASVSCVPMFTIW
jgi:hypothetical protein